MAGLSAARVSDGRERIRALSEMSSSRPAESWLYLVGRNVGTAHVEPRQMQRVRTRLQRQDRTIERLKDRHLLRRHFRGFTGTFFLDIFRVAEIEDTGGELL